MTIVGECYPEDIVSFSRPIFDATIEYLERAEEFEVELELFYFNSSSAKFLYDFFEILEQAATDGKKIVVNWKHDADDDSMLEAGEDFAEDFKNAKFNLREI